MPAAPAAQPPLDDREAPLFPADFLQRLAYLHLIARKVLSGELKAEHRSRKKGASIEFADHRPYSPGDDFRFIDWGVYFRTDNLFLKLFEEEEDLPIYILVDASGSMDFGMPYKWHYARRLAAAIAYLGLASMDRVMVVPFTTALPTRGADWLRLRGKAKIYRLLDFLEGQTAAGETSLTGALTGLARSRHKRGMAIVVSDLYDNEGLFDALNALRYQKFECFVAHIVSPQEAEPGLLGDVRLIDAETNTVREVTLTESMLRAYASRFTEWCGRVETFCRQKEIGYARCRTDIPFDETVVHMLRRGRLFQ
jgi:uncharacterized protein (DUF58 family)